MFLLQLTWCQRWNGAAPCPALHLCKLSIESTGCVLFLLFFPASIGCPSKPTFCFEPPIIPNVYVNVSSGLSGSFITHLCVDANEASGHWNPVFSKTQQALAAGHCVNLSFINKQKLMCLWPENLRVMRPTLEI